ncbi:HAD family hydrolase, partial [Burkholderia vietnamiensis]
PAQRLSRAFNHVGQNSMKTTALGGSVLRGHQHAPYAEPLLSLLPFEPDACAWSFEVGYLKPDPRIFEWVCERLNVAACEAVMVGDTFADDYAGALASGLNALHLDRRERSHQKTTAVVRTLYDVLPALRCRFDAVSGGQIGSGGLS